jgi:tRNA threonylcarbamoyladenosine biosynthesis protein TsaE
MHLKNMKIYRSFSSEETKRFSEKLARQILNSKFQIHGRKHALVFALQGELGAGKTTFVQGFFRGLGLKKGAPSPTFIIMRRTSLRNKKFKNVFHVDAYRLKKTENLTAIGFPDVLANPENIVLIEWAENIKKILPKKTTWLKFHHGKKESERKIEHSEK